MWIAVGAVVGIIVGVIGCLMVVSSALSKCFWR